MLKTESQIKNYLKSLSDEQIKKMIDGLDFSPFPILLTIEHEKRFGSGAGTKKNQKDGIKKKIIHEKKNQRVAVSEIKLALKQIVSSSISPSGTESLTDYAIKEIHQKTEEATKNFLQSANTLAISTKKISQLEQEYKSLF